jgi:hypothetical protein
MAASAALLHGPTDQPPPPLSNSDAYRVAVEEYRFQAQFNWQRSQYLLGFNALILAAGVGLKAPAGQLAMLVFGLGFAAAVLSAIAVWTQHGYYRVARAHLQRVEVTLSLPSDLRLDTTSKLGGRKRLVSVNQIVYLLLAAMAVANAVGAYLAAGT